MIQRGDIINVVDFSDCPCDKLDKSVTNVVKLLVKKQLTIATAESCTGGLLSAYLTSVDGASAAFECGLCTYSNRMKELLLGVPHEILTEHGAVSASTAAAMAAGLARLSGADICVSVTGIAGPTGGTPEKPVGTVYVGMQIREKMCVYLLSLWHLDDCSREHNRRQTTAFIMKTIETLLMEESS